MRITSGRRLVAAGLLAMVLAASVASAQRIMVAPGRFATAPAKLATPEDFDGSFIYCRGAYQSVVREAGGTGWSTDYPAADNNFSVRLMELTLTHVKLDVERQPNTVVVRLTDPLLYRCPILFMEDVGTARFTHAARSRPCTTTSSRAASSGSTISGDRGRGRSGNARSAASCRRPNSRSSTFPAIIRSCTRSTT